MKIAATACLGLHGASGPGATTQHVQAASNFLKISDRVLIRSERRAPLTEADLPLSAARCVEAVRAVEGDNEAASRTSDKEESVTTTILQEEATPFANRSALNRARVLDPRLGSMLKPEQATVCGACRTVKILVDEAANKRCGEGGAEVACPRMSARDVWNHNLKAGFMAAAIGDGDDAAPRDPARDTTYQSLRVCNGLAPKLHRARETHFVSHRTDFAVSIGKTAGNVCGARLKRLARALLAAVHGVVRRELGSFQSAADRQQMRESGFLRAPTATKSGIPMAELVLLELETVVGHRDHSWGTNAPLGDLIPENDTFTVSMLLEGPDFVDGCMGCGSKIAGA